jgi:hypothetical protein
MEQLDLIFGNEYISTEHGLLYPEEVKRLAGWRPTEKQLTAVAKLIISQRKNLSESQIRPKL